MKHKEIQQPKIRSVKFNVVMNMILTTSSFLFPLITVPYVSRVLGPSGMGIVSWVQTLITYFSLIAMLGMTSYGTRACAEVRDDREKLSQVTQELILILVISTTITYCIYLVAIFLIPKTRNNLLLAFIFSLGIWLTSCGCNWFYQAIEQYGYITVRNIASKFVGLLLMFILVRTVHDYVWYAVTIVVGSYGSNIFNLIRLHKFVDFKRHRKYNLRRHFKPMVSFTISSISAGMYAQIDMLLSGFFLSNTLVGVYQMVVKIKSICSSAVNSVGAVMLPRLTYYEAKQGHEKTRQLIGKNINFIMILSLGMMIILCICGDSIIQILGGSQYLNGVVPLALTSPVLLFSATNSMLTQYLNATKREKESASVNLFGLIVGVIFGCILIPKYNIIGAALSVLLCEGCALIVRVYLLRDFIRTLRGQTDIWKIVIAAIFAGVAVGICKQLSPANPLILLIICGTVLVIVYLLALLILKEKFIRQILHKQ